MKYCWILRVNEVKMQEYLNVSLKINLNAKTIGF